MTGHGGDPTWGEVQSYYQIAETAAKEYTQLHDLPAHKADDLVQEGVAWLLERPSLLWARAFSGEPETPLTDTIAQMVGHFDGLGISRI